MTSCAVCGGPRFCSECDPRTKYEALVDAVRQCIDQSMENGHGIPPYGVLMYERLAELDAETADRTSGEPK